MYTLHILHNNYTVCIGPAWEEEDTITISTYNPVQVFVSPLGVILTNVEK